MTTFVPEDVQLRKWEFYGTTGAPLYVSIYPPLYTKAFLAHWGISCDTAIVWEGKQIKWFIDGAQFTQLAQHVLPLLLEQGWSYYDAWEHEAAVFEMHHYELMHVDLRKCSDSEVRDRMRAYRESFSPQFITNNLVEFLSYYFQHNLADLLVQAGAQAQDTQHFMHEYGKPAREGYLKCAAKEYATAKSPEEVAAIIFKYHYIRADYRGPQPVTEVDLKELVTASSIEDVPPISIDMPETLRRLLTVVQLIATMQDARKAQLLMMVCAARKFAEEFARRSDVSLDLLEFTTWAEIENGWFDAEIVKFRQGRCFMYWDKDGVASYVGAEASEISRAFENHVLAADSQTKEIKGISASRGETAGRVVVVTDPGEFGKVQQGDILVTVMTRPEYLPVMYKAAAFLCDEGGITSHAAIVAREMKKPCIIALKIATKVLKDGDLVEVDATAGIVRILKRA